MVALIAGVLPSGRFLRFDVGYLAWTAGLGFVVLAFVGLIVWRFCFGI